MYSERPSKSNSTFTAVLSGALLALVVSGSLFSPLFKLSHLEVNLNPFTTQEELLKSAGLTMGESVLPLIRNAQVAKQLKNHPYVESAVATKLWPSGMKFDIVYREDSFAIPSAGFFIILDKELQVLRVDQMAYDAYLIDGVTFKEFQIGKKITVDQPKILLHMVELKALMQKSHIGFAPKLSYDGSNIIATTKLGISASFGDGKNIEKRFNHFAEIYDNLQPKGIKTGLIDVSSDGLPTYKPFGK